MKAFLLAAGRGSRLRPYTDHTPKCLMPIRGKPLLQIWLEMLARSAVRDILINTHHLADQVQSFVEKCAPPLGLNIQSTYEPVLLGSGGTLQRNRGFVEQEPRFLIVYADNLTDMDVSQMVDFHRHRCEPRGGILTMGLFRAPEPRRCGIAVLDNSGKIVKFVEKPETPPSPWANAGIYVATRALFDFIPPGDRCTVLDLGHDILPHLAGRMYGYSIQTYLRDIGTVASYRRAQREWPGEPAAGF